MLWGVFNIAVGYLLVSHAAISICAPSMTRSRRDWAFFCSASSPPACSAVFTAATPLSKDGRHMKGTVPFAGRIRHRVWAAGAPVSNVGTWMQRTAQDWIVLTELPHRNATAVGITMRCSSAHKSCLAAERRPIRRPRPDSSSLKIGIDIGLHAGRTAIFPALPEHAPLVIRRGPLQGYRCENQMEEVP